jgi:hypothetical protein
MSESIAATSEKNTVVTGGKYGMFLLCLLLASALVACHKGSDEVVLLKDTDFSKGFGIGDYFVEEVNVRGEALTYRDVSPYRLKSFPAGETGQSWKFQEGVHRDYTDESGTHVGELFEHRFNISGQVLEESPERLHIAIYNNYRLREDDPLYNKRLVRSVDTDRKGKIRLYFNTQNLIRNVANTHEPKWKNDTWPHFLLTQRIDSVDMARCASVPVSFTVTLLDSKKLSDRMAGGPVPEKANFLSYFRVMNKNTGKSLWLGICMYTSCGQELFYQEIMSVDQHGTGMYRFPVREYGGPLEIGETKTYAFDLRKILTRALDNPKSREGRVSPDDYIIVGYNIGWECIGDHETEIEVSGLSGKAILK